MAIFNIKKFIDAYDMRKAKSSLAKDANFTSYVCFLLGLVSLGKYLTPPILSIVEAVFKISIEFSFYSLPLALGFMSLAVVTRMLGFYLECEKIKKGVDCPESIAHY